MNHTIADDANAPRKKKPRKNKDDANSAATACLLPDVLASIFLRLPASDLRRFRRVCKYWREVISDPVFIKEYVDHGLWAPTHTIVFLHGREESDAAATEPHNGHGFLFDEDWRLVARFTAGDSEEMVGTCDGLLCFLDVHQGAIKVVEPFTGESLALPLPPKTEMLHEGGAYCFGFDPVSRRYKIFHLGLNWLPTDDDTTEQGLYVYTIGGGANWKRVHVARIGEAGESYRDPVLADGSLYWSVETDDLAKLTRFDLATEEITSAPFTDLLPVMDHQDPTFHLTIDSEARMCLMTVGYFGEWDVFSTGEDGRSMKNGYRGLTLHPERHFTSRQALQRGHLLLQTYRDGGLYAHPIEPAGHDLGSGKLLLKIRKEKDKEPAKSDRRVLFVPALLNQVPEMVVPLGRNNTSSFCYAPPVCPAPLAHRCGFPCGSPQPPPKKQKCK